MLPVLEHVMEFCVQNEVPGRDPSRLHQVGLHAAIKPLTRPSPTGELQNSSPPPITRTPRKKRRRQEPFAKPLTSRFTTEEYSTLPPLFRGRHVSAPTPTNLAWFIRHTSRQ
eukprot:1186845-Prorocentrum_minimum.AAC.5